jgi:hypothetical protein
MADEALRDAAIAAIEAALEKVGAYARSTTETSS